MTDNYRFIRFFRDIGIEDVGLVGGKNAALGEMYRQLSAKGVKVPNGFAITAEAYRSLLDGANAWEPLRAALEGLQPDDAEDLRRRGARARAIIHDAPMREALETEILRAYRELCAEYGDSLSVTTSARPARPSRASSVTRIST
jgi:pyruvate,water dikinase